MLWPQPPKAFYCMFVFYWFWTGNVAYLSLQNHFTIFHSPCAPAHLRHLIVLQHQHMVHAICLRIVDEYVNVGSWHTNSKATLPTTHNEPKENMKWIWAKRYEVNMKRKKWLKIKRMEEHLFGMRQRGAQRVSERENTKIYKNTTLIVSMSARTLAHKGCSNTQCDFHEEGATARYERRK